MSNRKAPMTNLAAELALLGSLVRANAEERVQIAQAVREDWFADAGHLMAWRVASNLVLKAHPLDLTLLEDGLLATGCPAPNAKKMTAALADAMPTAGLWKPLCQRLQGYFLRRRGIDSLREAIANFESADFEPEAALAGAESSLFALHNQGMGAGMQHVSASVDQALKSLAESMMNRGHVTGGLPTGITDLDRINIKGMRPGHVWVVGAPPGKGKTVFLMKVAWNLAAGEGDYPTYQKYHPPVPVGIFSLEMSDYQLAERLLLTQSELLLHKMQQGHMSGEEKQKLQAAAMKVCQSQLHLEYCPGASIQELRIKARYAVARYDLKLLGFDYAQLIGSLNPKTAGNRTAQMQEVSMGLDLIASECGVPVIVLAQPKQESWGLRAKLGDFGETSQLAKDADMAGHLGEWNPKILGVESDAASTEEDDDIPDDEKELEKDAYFDAVKNRHGPDTVGKTPIRLQWVKHLFKFTSRTTALFDSTGRNNQHNAA